MESNNLYSKNYFINTLYNKTDILTWNISDPLIIKEDNINNNILLESSYNEIIDKNINNIDILKSFENE